LTISDQITRLNNAKAAIKQSIENKGVEVSDTALLDEYPALIDSIEAGGGEGGGSSYVNPDFYEIRTVGGTNYSYLFYKCEAGQIPYLSNWDTNSVTTMQGMFQDCSKLTSLDLSSFNTSNVTTMERIFSNGSSLTTLNLNNWDTSNLTNMGYMFYSCQSLTSLDLSNFDTSKVTNMYCTFQYCYALTSLNLSNFDMTNVSTSNTNNMLQNCKALHTLRLDNCSNDTINKIITSKNFPTNAIEGVTRKIYCKESEATGLTAPTNWVFEYVEEPIPLYVSGEFSNKGDITEVRTMVNNTHTSLRNMFSCCFNLATVNTQDWDTSNVTDMGYMFNYCHKLTSLDLSAWNTSKVTDMGMMFMNCSNLTTVDLSNFDMTNVTNYMSMFSGCYELHTVRLDNCDSATVNKIISELPKGTVNGETRKIYVSRFIDNITPPNGWVFASV
jgi:surface protein